MVRLAYVTSHPIQYQAPLFRRLAARADTELKVFFNWKFGVEATHDPDFNREIKWDIPLLDGYEHAFAPNLSPRPGTDHFLGLVNPAIIPMVIAYKPDAVVVHGYAHATEHLVIAACKAARIPVLLRGESHLLPHRTRLVRAVKAVGAAYLKRMLAGVVAIGTLNRDYFRHYGVPEGRIFMAPYAVDNDFFQAGAAAANERATEWREELGIAADTLTCGFAAKLSAVKACGDLIDAFGRAAVPNTALIIAGDGPLRAELEAKAAGYPNAQICFAGFVNQSEMPAAYAISDVFALPSNFEPWGLGINEAMNLARPVIVSDQIGCAPDLVSPANGWVFPANDVDRLAAVMTDAFSDRARLRAMGEASLARIDQWSLRETAEGFYQAAAAVSR